MPQTPYLYGGTIKQSDDATPSSGTTITIIQNRTNETQSTTTNSNGQYLFDISNFTSYEEGDFYTFIASGSSASTQELRMKIISRDTFQIPLIKVKYNV